MRSVSRNTTSVICIKGTCLSRLHRGACAKLFLHPHFVIWQQGYKESDGCCTQVFDVTQCSRQGSVRKEKPQPSSKWGKFSLKNCFLGSRLLEGWKRTLQRRASIPGTEGRVKTQETLLLKENLRGWDLTTVARGSNALAARWGNGLEAVLEPWELPTPPVWCSLGGQLCKDVLAFWLNKRTLLPPPALQCPPAPSIGKA